MNNPAGLADPVNQGARHGLGADVGRLPCARRGYRLAGRRARQAAAISGLTGGVGCAAPFPKEPDSPGSSRLLWATRRRFDPSSSPSASLASAPLSPAGLHCKRSPISTAVLHLSSGLLTFQNLPIILRNSCFSPNLWTSLA
jgi:hypothetical protein